MFRKDLALYKDEYLRKRAEQIYQRRIRESNFNDPLGFLNQADKDEFRSVITDEDINKFLVEEPKLQTFEDLFKIQQKKKIKKIDRTLLRKILQILRKDLSQGKKINYSNFIKRITKELSLSRKDALKAISVILDRQENKEDFDDLVKTLKEDNAKVETGEGLIQEDLLIGGRSLFPNELVQMSRGLLY